MTAVRRAQLIRFGTWVSLATIAVFVVVLTARTESGIRRIATLIAPAEPERMSNAPQLARRDQEEQRRLADAVRTLSVDRDRLVARLATLEHSLDEVTGSIPPASSKPSVPPSSAPSIAAVPSVTAPAVTPAPAQAAGMPAPARPGAADSVATKTEFGVDIGGNASIEGLRAQWASLKASQPALFDGLRPVIAIREGAKPGVLELRLVAGPLPNASIAARLCAALSAAGQTCQPAVFDGQRLALQ
jgi:hypothetical protein